jgi:hypothetical protein
MRRAFPIVLATTALWLLLAAPGHAARALTAMEDPAIAPGMSLGPELVVPAWKRMGVDIVRIQAFWNAIAPDPNSPTPPAGFDPANPSDPRYDWSSLDRSIALVRANGMRVMLTVHQLGPVWSSQQPSMGIQGWMPDPRQYAAWATALARRYGSSVDVYLMGNEPNEKVFLSPQTTCGPVGGRVRCQRVAPVVYANLIRAAYPAIKAVDPGSTLIIGELAPIGGVSLTAGNIAPLAFIRGMGCLNDKYRPIRFGVCAGFKPLRGDAFGYHPYQLKARPDQHNPSKNGAKLGDIKRLLGVIDAVTKKRRILPPRRRFDLYFTEYGYESNPPETRYGVPPETMSRYLQWSAYLVWKAARVKMIGQYLWRDDPLIEGTLKGFQSGLHYADGTPKPALASFPHPFYIDRSRGRRRAVVWGQVRPDGVRTATVFRQIGTAPYKPWLTAKLDSYGYFSATRALARNSNYFYSFRLPDGTTQTSDVLHAG